MKERLRAVLSLVYVVRDRIPAIGSVYVSSFGAPGPDLHRASWGKYVGRVLQGGGVTKRYDAVLCTRLPRVRGKPG